MYRVLKYRLDVTDKQTILLPTGSKVVSVAVQKGLVVAYAVVPKVPFNPHCMQEHTFYILGTGHETSDPLFLYDFLGTISLYSDQLMFHIFHSFREVPSSENADVFPE